MHEYDLKRLLRFAHDTFGLVLTDSQQKKVGLAFRAYLEKSNRSAEEIFDALADKHQKTTQNIVSLLTIQESYFFRDASLFLLLKEEILPNLIQSKRQAGNLSLTIWSAGCSRGEELYSLAILLRELIPDYKNWRLILLGTDIDAIALEHAKAGIYSKLGLRAIDDSLKQKYFITENEKYLLESSVKAMAKFAYGNLLEPSKFSGCVDLIFCRNVFIYFDESAIDKALLGFDKALSQDGILFLGCSDFVRYHQKHFTMVFKNGVTYFTKPEAAPMLNVSNVNTTETPSLSYAAIQEKRREALEVLDKQLEQGDFTSVIAFVDKENTRFRKNPALYRYKAEALIGLGDLSTAQEILEAAVKDKVMDPTCYFLLGLIEMNQDKIKSERYFTQAIYLKKAFPEAHYYLGMLYLSSKRKDKGLKTLEKAKHYAALEEADKKVIASDSNMHELMDSITDEITYYQRSE